MILTCPSCATRYFVKDEAVPEAGRPVRCAACGHEWRAQPFPETAPLTLESAATPGGKGKGKTGKPARAEPRRAAAGPRAWRARAQAQKQTRRAVAAGVAWGAVSVAFVALAFLAVLFRVEVVRAFPRANAAYAAVRMPVNPTGLALEGVTGGPGLENGRQILLVTGALRNVEAGPRRPWPLLVSVWDRSGRRLVTQRVQPAPGEVGPGEARAFRAVFPDPPLDAAEFGVDFDWSAPATPARKRAALAAHPAAAPQPAPAAVADIGRGPVAEAAPLPASDPAALPAPAH